VPSLFRVSYAMARSTKRLAVIHVKAQFRMFLHRLDVVRNGCRYRQSLRRSPAIPCAFLADVSGMAKHGSTPTLVLGGIVMLDG